MKSYKPRTASRRHMTSVDYGTLFGVRPHKALLTTLKSHAGRNSQGRITVRHQGGGNKKRYRMIDFKQLRHDMSARITTIEYDPYRSGFIALIEYEDGVRSYILAPQGVAVGTDLIVAESAPLKPGNRLKLKNIPVGYQVHNVELGPGRGGQLARSAGSYAEVLAYANGYTDLKLSSGEVRRVLKEKAFDEVRNEITHLVPSNAIVQKTQLL